MGLSRHKSHQRLGKTCLRRLCTDLRQRLAERQSVQARLAEALLIH